MYVFLSAYVNGEWICETERKMHVWCVCVGVLERDELYLFDVCVCLCVREIWTLEIIRSHPVLPTNTMNQSHCNNFDNSFAISSYIQ